MYVAALLYHYGAAVGISYYTHVWFQELGGRSMLGPSGVSKLLEDLFQDLWLPQIVVFIRYQVERVIRGEGGRREVSTGAPLETLLIDNRQKILDRWADS